MTLFLLIAGHFLADYPLQGDGMAVHKSPWDPEPHPAVPWFYWMTSHCMAHAGLVALITGSVLLGVLELVCHFALDVAKCAGYTDLHVDQVSHLIFKLLWVVVLTAPT